jgi:hypothetical protein
MADPTLSARTFQETLPYFPESLGQDADRWNNVHDWLLSRGVIKKKLPVKQLFTNAFAPKGHK